MKQYSLSRVTRSRELKDESRGGEEKVVWGHGGVGGLKKGTISKAPGSGVFSYRGVYELKQSQGLSNPDTYESNPTSGLLNPRLI